MPPDLVQCLCEVNEGGYQWLKAIRIPAPGDLGRPKWNRPRSFLTTGLPVGASGLRVRRYNPLRLDSDSGLFRTFAELDPTPDGIRAFADKYGLLGGDLSVLILLQGMGAPSEAEIGVGESRKAWAEEIRAMRQAVALWDMLQAGDTDKLSRHFWWEGQNILKYVSDPPSVPGEGLGGAPPTTQPQPESFSVRGAWLERFHPGDVIEPARYAVQRLVNRHLKEWGSSQLLWERRSTRLRLHLVPDGLAGALWLQFARAIDGEKTYRRCRECPTWFELSPDIARTNRFYCSDACRLKAYRRRKAHARQLHAGGMPLEEIARQLGTDLARVRGWVSRSPVPRSAIEPTER
jgi:hypothetical protein